MESWRRDPGEAHTATLARSNCLGGSPYGNERIESGRSAQGKRTGRWGGQLPCAATHVLQAFAQVAAASGRSYSIILQDLEKAFDMVSREFFMGARADEEEVTVAKLVAMGVPERVAEWTCEFVRERGSVLEQWGVDGKVAKLMSAIHTHSWVKHECAKEVVVTTRGGRQVCKIWSVIFGAVYVQALKDLRCYLILLGLMRSESTMLGQPFCFWRHVRRRERLEEQQQQQ